VDPHQTSQVTRKRIYPNVATESAVYQAPGSYNESKKKFYEEYDLRQNYESKRKLFRIAAFFLNFGLVIFSVLLLNFFRQNSFMVSDRYVSFFLLLSGVWFVVSLLFQKFERETYRSYHTGISSLLKSNVAVLFLLASLMVLGGLHDLSRVQTFGTVSVLFLSETFAFTIYSVVTKRRMPEPRLHFPTNLVKQHHFSYFLFLADFIMLTISFFAFHYYKRGVLGLLPEYQNLLWLSYGLWFLTGIFTGKFEVRNHQNIYYAIAPYIKSFFMIFSLTAITVYAFHLFYLSRIQIFGTFVFWFGAELAFYFLYYLDWSELQRVNDVHTISEVKEVIFAGQEPPALSLSETTKSKNRIGLPATEKLRRYYLKEHRQLFRFIEAHVPLENIDANSLKVLNTHTAYNIEVLENQTLDLIINLHRVNDFRYLNKYFLAVHRKIYNGGFFVGVVDTIETHRKSIFKKFPILFARVIYPIDFIVRRIIPKLPVFKKLYFFLTKGKNRVLSKAETLGRLSFCGFKIIATREINTRLYFIVQCNKNPSLVRDPSYGPVIKLNRVGLNGEPVYIRKFRTMHPYSEFLQEYVFQKNNLQENGKFKQDFRVTEWGKVLRRFWLDELPQLVNFIRGDLALVGVRALSEQYFNLYPDDLKNLRVKFKPGLFPPYYADLPKNFDEIVASEREYLAQKMKQPFVTDVKYFTKAVFNILFKKARSL